jgi:hypothetical protein
LTDLEEFWKTKWANIAQSRFGKVLDLPGKKKKSILTLLQISGFGYFSHTRG